ncbi:MAG: metal-dependent transcriptional regulator [Thermoleophilia bacterium]|jgi:DtxR family Mn-dependent transcriptional regulator
MGKKSESREEYLEAMFKLELTPEEVSVKRLATALGVAAPSVSEMLVRMRAAGLVTRTASGAVALSDTGHSEGARLVRRHRLSERFLADYLNLPWDQVHAEACKFEHVLSDEVEARLAQQLGNPTTCPHGNAIPGVDGVLAEPASRPLADLGSGDHAVIACISDEKPDLLRYLASLGLLPETQIDVEGVAPFGGPLLVRVAGAQYALGREVAGKIYVHGEGARDAS